MKNLEQILEKIGEMPYPSEGIGCGLEDVGITDRYEAAAYEWNEAVERIGEIIRSHMEDGTKGLIDVEDERFWNILSEEACVEGVQAERISKRLKEICAPHIGSDGWIPAKTPPKRNTRVQALIKHHKWITDYDSDWVPEEEKTVHPEYVEVCEAIYKNGEFTFRSMEDDEFAETAHISPEENIANPVCEILMWRPIACVQDNWIPAEYPPETDTYILLSFSNFSLPMIGRYEEDGNGGAFYLGDCDGDDTCIGNDLYVNAWQPLPQQYHTEEDA